MENQVYHLKQFVNYPTYLKYRALEGLLRESSDQNHTLNVLVICIFPRNLKEYGETYILVLLTAMLDLHFTWEPEPK